MIAHSPPPQQVRVAALWTVDTDLIVVASITHLVRAAHGQESVVGAER